MDFTPTSVSGFLFSGIYSAIERLLKVSEEGWEEYHSQQVYEVIEAVEWYNEHSVISGASLTAKLESLKPIIESKFIYDGIRNVRYTFRYNPVADKVVEYNNCLMHYTTLSRKEIEVGKIVKAFNGDYMKITEVFEIPDNKYGYFIGESLSIEELLNLKPERRNRQK